MYVRSCVCTCVQGGVYGVCVRVQYVCLSAYVHVCIHRREKGYTFLQTYRTYLCVCVCVLLFINAE